MKKVLLGLALLFASATLALAQRTVTGKVTDEQGEPLIGATVLVKGTTSGAVSDVNGVYKVNVSKDDAILVATYSGFATIEIPVGTTNAVDIVMKEGLILQETVVTAFGIKKNKENLGYAVTEISSQELTTARVTNVTNALAAKAPGVRVSGSGGSFTGSSIIIRGFTTFTGSNQPLFVVDGVPIDNGGGGTPLQSGPAVSNRAIDLNQEDIESLSVLKGAAATALYGSRAASGVVLITTKKGKAGLKNAISYSANYAFQEVNRTPDYQNTYGQGIGGNFSPTATASWGPRIAGQNVILPPAFRGGLVTPNDSVQMTAYPDNVTDIFQRGSNMQHNIAFQGSKEDMNYRLSLGYLDDQGIIDNNRLKRYNVGFNGSSKITSKLTAGISVNYSLNKSDRTQQGNQLSNPLFRGWFTPRSWNLSGLPYKTATGTQLHYDVSDNPYWTIEQNLYDDNINRILGNINLRYQLLDWLSVEYKLGVDNYVFSRRAYDEIGATGGGNTNAGGQGGILEGRNTSRLLNSNLTLVGNRQIGKDLDLTFVLGQEAVDDISKSATVSNTQITVRDFRNLNANTRGIAQTAFGTSQGRIIGAYANLTTVYRNFATIDLAVRNDWNSTLRKGNNSYLYYSVAGTLNLTEAFPSLKSEWVRLAKIRANYGRTGKANTRYATDSYYGQANPADGFGPNILFPFNGLAGFSLFNGAGNPLLEPEFTTSAEVGVDLSLVKDRLSIELTRYQTNSTGVILAVPNSSAAGISSVVLNAGSLETKGWEAGITITPIKTKSGFWSTTFNFTQFKSVVEDLAPGVQNVFLGGFVTPNVRLVVGDEYGQLYGNKYKRDANGTLLLNANGFPQPTANVDKIGNPNPDWTLGVSNNINYKAITLGVLLDIRTGGDQYSRNLADLRRNGVVAETAEFNRFNEDGTVATPYKFEGIFETGPNAGQVNGGDVEKRLTTEQYWGNAGKHVAAEGFIYDISWFRIREASLTYNLPKKMLDKSPFGALEISVFGRNLFLHAPNYPHLDPEQNALGISNASGLEFNALPQTRSYGASLRVTL